MPLQCRRCRAPARRLQGAPFVYYTASRYLMTHDGNPKTRWWQGKADYPLGLVVAYKKGVITDAIGAYRCTVVQ